MVRSFGILCVFALGLMVSAGSALALGPVNSLQSSDDTKLDLLDASFLGRPYPFGFAGWGHCIRYVEVETRWGLRLRRVRVCR
jgi:hypothetical protein